ncbi:MAG: hypothetical protein J6C37_01530 [Roseburia sp.]|nr:hypothetical protein [Roseburia sp.]
MNFGFFRECGMEQPKLQKLYIAISKDLEQAEWHYRENPQKCGVLLREAAEKICRLYSLYYDIGFREGTPLEQFLCYTENDEHNAMVSHFLSVVRREQRDRLNKLRVLGDDCIWGEEVPNQGMSFEERMSQNAKRMMGTMMEVLKVMCSKIGGRTDLDGLTFSEDALPEQKKAAEPPEPIPEKAGSKSRAKFRTCRNRGKLI